MAAMALPVLAPRSRRAGACCPPVVEPGLVPAAAEDLSAVAKALGDPTRLRLLDTLRRSAPQALCQCELVPLFDMSQPALSKHLRILVSAGIVGSERRGLWTYYFIPAETAVKELVAWLS